MNPDTKRMNRTSIPKAENRPIIDPKISPDNQNICAYYSQNDLYVQDLTKGRFSRYQKIHIRKKSIFEKKTTFEQKIRKK